MSPYLGRRVAAEQKSSPRRRAQARSGLTNKEKGKAVRYWIFFAPLGLEMRSQKKRWWTLDKDDGVEAGERPRAGVAMEPTN